MTIRVTNDIDFSKVGNIAAEAVDVGFFESATYDDGTPVAAVAARNEFGDASTPERPFFRQAIRRMERVLLTAVAAAMQANGVNLPRREINRVGERAVGIVQESIVNLRQPPNAPATVERKGSSNPLVDTGVMLGSVGYEVRS